jgi:hypothetical protein
MGKTFAYTAVLDKHNCFALGVALANEPGYYPVSCYHYQGETYHAAAQEADRLNTLLGHSEDGAINIVVSTHVAQRAKREREDCNA